MRHFGPTRLVPKHCTNQADVASEDDYDDGRRAFVYWRIGGRCADRRLGDDAEDDEHLVHKTVIVRFYNAHVHACQEAMSYDNCDRAFVSGLPEHWYCSEEIYGEDGEADEATAFEEGYTVYDFIAAWAHLEPAERRYHPTAEDDPRGGKSYAPTPYSGKADASAQTVVKKSRHE